MTDRPLPEAVEKALVAFSDAVSDMENGHATNDDAVRAEDALRAAIDAAMAPGEPVAHRDVVTTWNADHAALSVRFAGPDVPVARTVSVRHDPLVNVDYAEDGSIHSVEVLIPPGTVPGELPIIHGFVGGPIDPFADALAKVDVEVTDRRDDGTPFYTVLGLKEVEAAHRAEVERHTARIARLEAALREATDAIRWAHDAFNDLSMSFDAEEFEIESEEADEAAEEMSAAYEKARAALEEPRRGDTTEAAEGEVKP